MSTTSIASPRECTSRLDAMADHTNHTNHTADIDGTGSPAAPKTPDQRIRHSVPNAPQRRSVGGPPRRGVAPRRLEEAKEAGDDHKDDDGDA